LNVAEPDKEEITGGWGKLRNVKHYYLSFSPNMIKVIRSVVMNWSEYGGHKEPTRNAHIFSAGNAERKRTL
jgi:hypothetical protein